MQRILAERAWKLEEFIIISIYKALYLWDQPFHRHEHLLDLEGKNVFRESTKRP